MFPLDIIYMKQYFTINNTGKMYYSFMLRGLFKSLIILEVQIASS